MGRIGLLGGTFDPIHYGHLRAAEEAYEALALQKVLFLPSPDPPHKRRPDLSPFGLRLEMVRLAVEGIPHFEPSDLEEKLPKPSYSVRTLTYLRKKSRDEIYFILGLDAFLELETWYQYRELPRLAHLVVVTRGEGGKEAFLRKLKELFPMVQEEGEVFRYPQGYTFRYLPMLRLDISSTYLRKLFREGRSGRFLLPEMVRRFVLEKALYQGDGEDARGDCGKNPG